MEKIEDYMEEFKTYPLEDKKKVALEQLKIIASLTNTMCEELGVPNELLITKDIVEAHSKSSSEDDFVEGIVEYASLIQNSLCKFIDKMTDYLKYESRE